MPADQEGFTRAGIPDRSGTRGHPAGIADHGEPPTSGYWQAARISLYEKTIRRGFGSFRSAITLATD